MEGSNSVAGSSSGTSFNICFLLRGPLADEMAAHTLDNWWSWYQLGLFQIYFGQCLFYHFGKVARYFFNTWVILGDIYIKTRWYLGKILGYWTWITTIIWLFWLEKIHISFTKKSQHLLIVANWQKIVHKKTLIWSSNSYNPMGILNKVLFLNEFLLKGEKIELGWNTLWSLGEIWRH